MPGHDAELVLDMKRAVLRAATESCALELFFDLTARQFAIAILGGERRQRNRDQGRDGRGLLLVGVDAEHGEHRQAGQQRKPDQRNARTRVFEHAECAALTAA